MNKLLAWAGVLALVVAFPQVASAQKDKKKDGPGAGGVVDAEKALRPGTLDGKLGSVAGNTLVLRLEYQRLELKQGGNGGLPGRGGVGGNNGLQNLVRQQQQMARLQQQMRTARSPQQQMQIIRQIQQQMANLQRQQLQQLGRGGRGGAQNSPFRVVTDHKDFEIQLAADAKVRSLQPPFAYDDMGNPKKYTPGELKELKGKDPRLPGYTAGMDLLRPGAEVRITLARNKETENKLQATLVVVAKESDQPLAPDKKKKKK